MIDTGEKLDIVYTTDSLIVITATDGHTPAVINRLEIKPPCRMLSVQIDFIAIWLGTSLLLLLTDGYIVVAHLLFKQLRNLCGM